MPFCRSTILRALPDYDRKLDEFLAPYEQENGFASTCWHDLLLAEAARCAKAARELLTAALADCHADFDQEQAAAEEKKTPSARAKAQLAVAEKYGEAGTRLEKPPPSLRRRSSWRLPDSGTRCMTCSPPMCWAWRKPPA